MKPRISFITLGVDDLGERLRRHREDFLPQVRRCQSLRQALVTREYQSCVASVTRPVN